MQYILSHWPYSYAQCSLCYSSLRLITFFVARSRIITWTLWDIFTTNLFFCFLSFSDPKMVYTRYRRWSHEYLLLIFVLSAYSHCTSCKSSRENWLLDDIAYTSCIGSIHLWDEIGTGNGKWERSRDFPSSCSRSNMYHSSLWRLCGLIVSIVSDCLAPSLLSPTYFDDMRVCFPLTLARMR